MRIGEKKVVQHIERPGYNDTIIIVDESTGNEVELTPAELHAVVHYAEYANFIARRAE